MSTSKLMIRPAQEDEMGLVLEYIRKIAAYEKLSDQVVATKESLYRSIFVNHDCEVVIGFEGDLPVGFALYFFNYSTFKGKIGLYLEDLFVDDIHRKKGYGKQLITYLMDLAARLDCGRMEWSCLDWNQKAIDFYLSLGAKPMDEWTVFRLDEKDLKNR